MDKKMIYGVAGCATLVVAVTAGIVRVVVKSRKKKETTDEKPAEVVETET